MDIELYIRIMDVYSKIASLKTLLETTRFVTAEEKDRLVQHVNQEYARLAASISAEAHALANTQYSPELYRTDRRTSPSPAPRHPAGRGYITNMYQSRERHTAGTTHMHPVHTPSPSQDDLVAISPSLIRCSSAFVDNSSVAANSDEDEYNNYLVDDPADSLS